MALDYQKLNKLARKHKSALTRAKNSGDPNKVVAAVDKFYADFEAEDAPLPDNWRLWENAKQDAVRELRQKAWSAGYDAYHDQLTADDNPYDDDLRSDAWDDGFAKADAYCDAE